MGTSFVTGLYGSCFGRFRWGGRIGVAAACAVVFAGGCSGGGGNGGGRLELGSDSPAGPMALEQEGGGSRIAAPGRPLALVEGVPIATEEAEGRLRELAGGVVLEELALEQLLEGELRKAGLSIGQEEIERERALLARTVNAGMEETGSAEAAADAAATAIAAVRRARGLGPLRYEALLKRNAMLRRLVEDEAAGSVTDEDVDLAMTIRYGPKARVRIIVTRTQREAAKIRGDLEKEPGRFAELAMRRSVDASAARGGLLAPISTADPAYPLALLTAIDGLVARAKVGADEAALISDVVLIDGGYALVKLEERLAGTEPEDSAAARAAMRAEVVLVRERSLMEARAARLLEEAAVTVFDPSMFWAWEQRTGSDER